MPPCIHVTATMRRKATPAEMPVLLLEDVRTANRSHGCSIDANQGGSDRHVIGFSIRMEGQPCLPPMS